MLSPGRQKILALLPDERLPDNRRLYDELERHVCLERILMTKDERRNIPALLSHRDLYQYDRIVLELRFKHAEAQLAYLRTLPNLVLIEDDTWQNYVCFGKNSGRFTRYYEKLQPSRIINSGYRVAQNLRAQGHDALFLGKGYDGTRLRNLHLSRDIELGFIGRLEHMNYAPRKRLLLDLCARTNLTLLRTEGDDEYLTMLNRIRFFVSADVQFGEHMIKNFEALACGCVVFAYRQGADDVHLGLKDMVNCVLYSGIDELIEKINHLKRNPDHADCIANRGSEFARNHHEYGVLARKYASLLNQPFCDEPKANHVCS